MAADQLSGEQYFETKTNYRTEETDVATWSVQAVSEIHGR